MTSQDLNFQYDFTELLYKQYKDCAKEGSEAQGFTVKEMEDKYSNRYNHIEFNFRRLKRKGYIENKNGDDYFTLTENGIIAIELSVIHDEILDKIDLEKSVNATLRSADASTLLSINQRSFNKSVKCITILTIIILAVQTFIFLGQLYFMNEQLEEQKISKTQKIEVNKISQSIHIQLDSVLTDALSNNDTVFVKNVSNVGKKKPTPKK